ncbi:MAG: PilT/PilU family type 4a pilus ATPase [Candidatus Staskawiczbacteria bacterium]|nr:PilT/PilU family type 4a pilus ATPase [Candidatus Staskawiczbacteria bacterium]
MTKELEELLDLTIKENASDLHISVGRYPTLRINGLLIPLLEKKVINPKKSEELIFSLITSEQKIKFLNDKQLDFSLSYKEVVRFRITIFHQRGYFSAAIRLIPQKIKTLEELNLPTILREFTTINQGFVLVVGPSGQGKSTTLAAMIDEINHSKQVHVITIEDPIEYIFSQDKSIISQIEIATDIKDFPFALKSVLREDPDVIMLGEMRDPETISAAITAAETGHLVFSTLHTNSASQTIDRIIDSFPSSQQNQIRTQLSLTLTSIFSQRLVILKDGSRMPVYEIMIATPAIRNLIRENKVHQIDLVIETSADQGMISLNKSLSLLIKSGKITKEYADSHSLNSPELKSLLS